MSLKKHYFISGWLKVFTQPKLSLPLILTLGLTLGAVLFVSTLVNTLLVKPMADIKAEQQLYSVKMNLLLNEQMSIPYWDFKRIASINEMMADVGEWAGIDTGRGNAKVADSSLEVTRYIASDNLLSVLGTELIKGNSFSQQDNQQQVWISHSLWQNQFAGMSSALGSTLVLDGNEYLIAGVVQDLMSVESSQAILPEQVWRVKSLAVEAAKPESTNMESESISVILKLGDSATPLPTADELKSWQENYIKSQSNNDIVQSYLAFLSNLQQDIEIKPYRLSIVGDSLELLTLLSLAVAGLLVMAVLNLLNLFIAHYQARVKEFGVHLAIGATPFRLRQLIFIENLPCMLLAAITGLLAAGWMVKLLPIIAQNSLPMLNLIKVDRDIVLVSLLVVVLINILFSSMALIDTKVKTPIDNLRGSGKGNAQQQKHWLSRSLMVAQLAIAGCLLTSTTMLAIKSYQLVYADLGYSIADTRTISMYVQDDAWAETLRSEEFMKNKGPEILLRDVEQIVSQQVTDAQLIAPDYAPLSWAFSISMIPHPNNPEQQLMFTPKMLTPGYFQAFNIAFLAGGGVTQSQLDNEEKVMVIDETAARSLFPDKTYQEIIGQAVALNDNSQHKVIGVVPAVKSLAGRNMGQAYPVLYYPSNWVARSLQFTYRMSDDKVIDTAALQQAIQQKYPAIGDVKATTLHNLWLEQTRMERTSLAVVLVITGLIIALACIGVSGLTQMTASARKHETAIRMAMGASQQRLVALLFKDALLMLALGLLAGFVLAALGYERLATSIQQLPAFNWTAMLSLNSLLVVVVCLSVLWPVWQMIKRDPLQTLREE